MNDTLNDKTLDNLKILYEKIGSILESDNPYDLIQINPNLLKEKDLKNKIDKDELDTLMEELEDIQKNELDYGKVFSILTKIISILTVVI